MIHKFRMEVVNNKACHEVMEEIHKFFNENIFTDIDVVVGEKKISTHKVILSACCGYFKKEITKESTEIIVPDCDNISNFTVENVFRYMYTGAIDLTNIGEMIKFVRLIEFQNLEEFIVKYLIDNFERVILEDYFTDISKETLLALIQSEELIVSEELIFKAVQTWVSKDVQNRREHLLTLLSNVKLHEIPELVLMREGAHLCRGGSGEVLQRLLDALIWQKIPDIRSELSIYNKPRCGITLLLTGGESPTICEVYHSKMKKWLEYDISTGNMFHSSVFSNGNLIMLGGRNNNQDVAQVCSLNLKTRAVETLPSMNHARSSFSSFAHKDDIYVCGGNSMVEKFDGKTRNWASVTIMPRKSTSILLHDSKIYVIGCYIDAIFETSGSNNMFNLANIQLQANSFPSPFATNQAFGISVRVLSSEQTAAFGSPYNSNASTSVTSPNTSKQTDQGLSAKDVQGTIDIYDIETNKWSVGPEMTRKIWGFASVTIEDSLYIIGGFDNSIKESVNTVERLNLQTKKWTVLANLPRRHHNLTATVFNGKIICTGGSDSLYVYEYDPVVNEWREISTVRKQRSNANLLVVPWEDLPDLASIAEMDVKDRKRLVPQKKSFMNDRYC